MRSDRSQEFLNSQLWKRNIIGKIEREIFSTSIENILLYGAETWIIKVAQENKYSGNRNGLLEKINQIISFGKNKKVQRVKSPEKVIEQ